MTEKVDQRIANMTEQVALPRQNGELVFVAPWEARAFGLAIALNEGGVYPWSDFSKGLVQETAAAELMGEPSTYYERWLTTLESLVIAHGLVTCEELAAMIAEQALHDDHHDHEHEHEHHEQPYHHNGHHLNGQHL